MFAGGWAAFSKSASWPGNAPSSDSTTTKPGVSALLDRRQREREWAARAWGGAQSGENDKNIRNYRLDQTEQLAGRSARTDRALHRLEQVDEPRTPWELRYDSRSVERSGDVVAMACRRVVERGGFRLGPVDLDIAFGDRVAVVGSNGSGKSTLLELLLGRIDPVGRPGRTPSRRIGEIEQEREGWSARSMLAAFCSTTRGVRRGTHPAREVRPRANQLDRPAATLSPGERTRACSPVLMANGANCWCSTSRPITSTSTRSNSWSRDRPLRRHGAAGHPRSSVAPLGPLLPHANRARQWPRRERAGSRLAPSDTPSSTGPGVVVTRDDCDSPANGRSLHLQPIQDHYKKSLHVAIQGVARTCLCCGHQNCPDFRGVDAETADTWLTTQHGPRQWRSGRPALSWTVRHPRTYCSVPAAAMAVAFFLSFPLLPVASTLPVQVVRWLAIVVVSTMAMMGVRPCRTSAPSRCQCSSNSPSSFPITPAVAFRRGDAHRYHGTTPQTARRSPRGAGWRDAAASRRTVARSWSGCSATTIG